jgi:phosphoribosylamine--glycine ligase
VKVLVVGGGGREHALCRALAKSPVVERLYAAPGNPGIAQVAEPVGLESTDIPAVVAFADHIGIDLTVIGPEAPLVAGLVDALERRQLRAFGPAADGARLEGSKSWARALCDRHGIPAPRSAMFTAVGPALEYLRTLPPPYVIKADGLAAGKGVTIAQDEATARSALEDCLVRGVFGESGTIVLVEEYLTGREVSALALTDGDDVVPLALAQDYKRALDGDRGPNTGGMGAYSPVPFVDPTMEAGIVDGILRAIVRALAVEGVRYRGVVYAGLMLTPDGPRVLEFNCRFGDPETQVILPRLESDLAEALDASARGRLCDYRPRWTARACVGVVVASAGYPGPHRTGFPISGLTQAAEVDRVEVFHAGTAERDGRVVTAGGRVVTVSALGDDLRDARVLAYRAASMIRFRGAHYRSDIGARSWGKPAQ